MTYVTIYEFNGIVFFLFDMWIYTTLRCVWMNETAVMVEKIIFVVSNCFWGIRTTYIKNNTNIGWIINISNKKLYCIFYFCNFKWKISKYGWKRVIQSIQSDVKVIWTLWSSRWSPARKFCVYIGYTFCLYPSKCCVLVKHGISCTSSNAEQ